MTLFLIHISLIEIKFLLFPFHITIRYPPLLPNPWRNSLQLPLRNYTETTGVFLFAPSTVGVKKLRRAPTFHFTCTRIGYVVVQAHDQHIVGKFHSINLVSRSWQHDRCRQDLNKRWMLVDSLFKDIWIERKRKKLMNKRINLILLQNISR